MNNERNHIIPIISTYEPLQSTPIFKRPCHNTDYTTSEIIRDVATLILVIVFICAVCYAFIISI